MEQDIILRTNVRLETLAGIVTAIHLWDIPSVQNKIQSYFSHPTKNKWRFRERWYKVVNKVNIHLKSLQLPNKFTQDLYSLVELIGDKIFSWNEYVIMDLGLDCKYAGKIQWTCKAEIDEGRVFKFFWQKAPGFCSFKRRIKCLGSSLNMLACIFVQEEFLKENLEKINKDIKQDYNIKDIVTFYLKSYLELQEESAVATVAAKEGLHLAAKFLLDRNNLENIMDIAQVCLVNITRRSNTTYKKEKFMNVFLYMLDQMPAEDKMNFMFDNIKLVANAFLRVWPFQCCLLQILNTLKNTNSDKLNEEYAGLLDIIIQMGKERNWCAPRLYRNMMDCIFVKILQMIPQDLKGPILLSKNFRICSQLFDSDNYNLLGYILNDPDLSDLKDEILHEGDNILQMRVQTLKLDEVDKFMEKVRLNDSEKKKLRNNYNLLENFSFMSHCVDNGCLELIDQFMLWLTDSESERINYKKNIDSSEILLTSLQKKVNGESYASEWNTVRPIDFNKLNAYLNWQFDTEKERINFKLNLNLVEIYKCVIDRGCISGTVNLEYMDGLLRWQFIDQNKKIEEIKSEIGSVEFICEKICVLWQANYFKDKQDLAESECLKLLNWVFGTNEAVIRRKKKEIVECQDFVKCFRDSVRHQIKELVPEAIERFLDFCEVPSQEKGRVMQAVFDSSIIEIR